MIGVSEQIICHVAGRRLSHRGMLKSFQERPLLLIPVLCVLALSVWSLLASWGCESSLTVSILFSPSAKADRRLPFQAFKSTGAASCQALSYLVASSRDSSSLRCQDTFLIQQRWVDCYAEVHYDRGPDLTLTKVMLDGAN